MIKTRFCALRVIHPTLTVQAGIKSVYFNGHMQISVNCSIQICGGGLKRRSAKKSFIKYWYWAYLLVCFIILSTTLYK